MTWGKPCDKSNLVTIRLFGGRKTWHRGGIYPLKYAELLALRTRYGQFLRSRLEAGHAEDVQTFDCRLIRGSRTTYSYHSWPRAIDIRPRANPMREDGVLVCDYARFGILDGVRFVSSFIGAGFDWGATWDDTDGATVDARCRLLRRDLLRIGRRVRSGRVDPMHFELDDDADAWSSSRALARLRAFRRRHPLYVRRVLRDAGVGSLRELLLAWVEGRA